MEILLSEIKEHLIFKTYSNGKQKAIINGNWSGQAVLNGMN